jgi:hypothetical protein
MGRIFISYSRKDTETVDRIIQAMCDAGLDVWIDRHNIQPGNAWRVQIVQAIDTCDAFVFMLSPNSAASENVRKEIDLAQDSGRKMFVLMLEPVKIPAEIHYQLAGLQIVNLQMLGFERSVGQLICTIKEHLSKLHPAEVQKIHQAELVIQGVDLKAFSADMQEQLLNFVAQLANASRTSLTIASMAAGSVHVFIDMPADAAFLLKTFALNRDKRFKRLKITSLRLAGDRKFVNIALGVLTVAATIGFLQVVWLSIPSMFVPVVGVTAGKVVTITIAVSVTAGLVTSAPKVVAPLFSASPTPTAIETSILIPVPEFTLKPTLVMATRKPTKVTSAHTKEPGQSSVSTDSSELTLTPVLTMTPQSPYSLVNTLCWDGPGDSYHVVSSIDAGVVLTLVAKASVEDWWIIENPRFPTATCWIRASEIWIDPIMELDILPIQTPIPVPPPPIKTKGQPENTCTDPYVSAGLDPYCYCYFHPSSCVTDPPTP